MAFTLDPTTDRGKVRYLAGDIDTATAANQRFDDETIDAFLALENNEVYAAAAAACEATAANHSLSAIAYKALKMTVDLRSVPKFFLELAKQFRERATAGEPWEEIDSYDLDITRWGDDMSEYVGDKVS